MKNHGSGIAYVSVKVFEPIRDTFHSLFNGSVQKGALAVGIGLFTRLISEHYDMLVALVVLVTIDQLFGVIVAMKRGKFVSAKFYNGLLKLLTYVMVIVAFHVLEGLNGVFGSLQLDTYAVIYLAITEMLSIVENFGIITGTEFPKRITNLLKNLGKKDEGDSQKGGDKR